jgi:ankyrin repeat protein
VPKQPSLEVAQASNDGSEIVFLLTFDVPQNDMASMDTLDQAVRTHMRRHLQTVFNSNISAQRKSYAAYTLATECLNDMAHWQGRTDVQHECLRWLIEAARLGHASAQSLVYRFHQTFGHDIPATLVGEVKDWLILATELGHPTAREDLSALASPDEFKDAIQTLRTRRAGLGRTRFGYLYHSRHINLEAADNYLHNWLATNKTSSIGDHYMNSDDTILHFAAASGFCESIVEWLKQRPRDVDIRGVDRETPLLLACRSGHHRVALVLLQNGANPTLSSVHGDTPLHWLLSFDDNQMETMAGALCASGGDPNALANGLNFEDAPQLGFPAGSPLHRAVSRGNLAAVKALLKVGAKPDVAAQGDHPFTSTYLAAQCHYPEILEALLQSTDRNPSVVDMSGYSLLITAIEGEGTLGDRFSKIVRHGPHWWQRAEKTLDLLMEFGANHHIHDLPGYPGCNALCLAARQGNERIIEYLLKHGASSDLNVESNVASRDDLKCTPLTMTIWKSRIDAFSLLLEHGADPKALTLEANGELVTSLYQCALMNHDETYFAEHLLKAKVEVDKRPPNYESAFAVAVRKRSFGLATLLLLWGADPHLESSCGLMVELPHAYSLIGFLILEQSLSVLPCLDYLFTLESHKSPHFIVCSGKGWTVLHLVALISETGRDDVACRAILLRLLKHFCPTVEQINQRASDGYTALHLAVFKANLEIAILLVEAGAREDIENGGLTPLDLIEALCAPEGFELSFSQPQLTGSPKPIREQIMAARERRESILALFRRAAEERACRHH